MSRDGEQGIDIINIAHGEAHHANYVTCEDHFALHHATQEGFRRFERRLDDTFEALQASIQLLGHYRQRHQSSSGSSCTSASRHSVGSSSHAASRHEEPQAPRQQNAHLQRHHMHRHNADRADPQHQQRKAHRSPPHEAPDASQSDDSEPPQRVRYFGRPQCQHRPNQNKHNDEEKFGKLKFTLPKFSGTNDPKSFLSWAFKVDKIFRVHNYPEEKMVAMASLEFEDYALLWWEQIQVTHHMHTWQQMKAIMRVRFVPAHYTRDLFKSLQELKKGMKSVEEYFKEMENSMMRANIEESAEQTMARFMNGLNYPIKRITEFQPYSNITELVHQATKAERQVKEDIRYTKTK